MSLPMPTPRLAAVDARVVRNLVLCRDHVAIEAVLPGFPASSPGQFLQLLCSEGDAAPGRSLPWPEPARPAIRLTPGPEEEAFLRRPFSIADRWDDADGTTHLLVISRAVGPGTRWLAALAVGDTLNLTGPLGRGFDLEDLNRPLVLLGGGVGIPPLLYLARVLHARGARDVTCIFGAMQRDLFPVPLTAEPDSGGRPLACLDLPAAAPFAAIVTTDDGSLGMKGYTTAALRAWSLQRRAAATPLVFACGPDGMLRAAARETRALGMDCQLCIEKPMGCGLATCLSCVTQVFDPAAAGGWRWALACRDGPVFPRDALLEYAEPPAQPAAGGS